MINSNRRQNCSVVNTLVSQQLGLKINISDFDYFTTLDTLQNLKPTINLKKCDNELYNQISMLQFNNKGNLLASTYFTNTSVCIWNWFDEDTLKNVLTTNCTYNPSQICWLPADDENTIVIGSHGYLELVDITSQSNRSLLDYKNENFIFRVQDDLPFNVLAASEYGKILNIDVRESQPQDLLTVKQDNLEVFNIYGIDINPAKSTQFCIAGLKTLRIYDTRNLLNPVQRLFLKESTMSKKCRIKRVKLPIKYNYDGSEILVSFPEEPIHLFKAAISTPIRTYATKTSENVVCFVGPRSEFIIVFSSYADGFFYRKYPHNLSIWNKDSEELIREIKFEEKCWGFDIHPSNPTIAINKSYEGLEIWK